MGCGFSNDKPESNLRNKDITNILNDTQRFNCDEESILSEMGTSQSKRSNKISKFRTSSVGTVGDLPEEDQENGNPTNSGKLFPIKGNNFKNNEINKKDGNERNNGNTYLQSNSDVSSSQVNFFKMLDEKIENGADFDEEEADRMRQIELLRCVEEWDQVLSKSQNNNKQLRCDDSTLSKSALANSSLKAADHSSSSNHKNSKNAFNKTSSDSQKKQHCDEQPNKLSKDNERSKRNNPTTSSSSTPGGSTSRSKETRKTAKENGGSFTSSNSTSNSINSMSENKDEKGRKEENDNSESKISDNSSSSKKSTSLRKPKLKPKESENSTSKDSNNASVNINAPKKNPSIGPQKSISTKASSVKPTDSSKSKPEVIANGSSTSDTIGGITENLDANGKRKPTIAPSASSSSKHLKDRGKKIN